MKNISCPSCSSCSSNNIIKYGLTFYKKQRYRCKICGRQFVLNGEDHFISKSTKDLINKLLLERISLAGICRSTGVSKSWMHLMSV